ncbi:MAG: undecaprenyl-phosphate glucose phosphotransferase [Steroidobacteraceae bacterium]
MNLLADSRSLIFRGSLSPTRALEAFLDPVVIVLMLVLITSLSGVSFDKRYFILAFVAFSAHFPGQPFLADSTGRTIRRALVGWALFAALLLLFCEASHYIDAFNRAALFAWLALTPFAVVGARIGARELLPRFLAREGQYRSAVIVGCNPMGLKLAQNFRNYPYAGVRFLGFFDGRSRDRLVGVGHMPLLGSFEQLPQYVKEQHVDHIYLSLPMASQPRVLKILEGLKDTTASVFFVPDIFITELIQGRVDDVAGIPVVAVCETPFFGARGLVKRLLDLTIASIALVLAAPLLGVIAIGVRRSSRGPIIFKQRRYGLDGKEILVYKFRTMNVMEDGASQYRQVTRGDERVTAFGARLRRLSLDELPQLFNVIEGTMSVIGPRPHAIAVNEQYRRLIARYMVRHKVRPGITGLAQVNGHRGGDDLESMTKRIECDLEYLRSWSLALDLAILAKTILIVLKGDHKAY